MIKCCPTCNRTYSDESISFCLADGALLSAPFDGQRSEPPPTEILPNLTPSEPTRAANPPVPTMTSLPGHNRYSPGEITARSDEPQSRTLTWIVFGIIAVVALVGVIFLVRYMSRDSRNDVAAQTTATPEQGVLSSASPTPLGSPSVSTSQPTPGARTTPTPGSSPKTTPSTSESPQFDPRYPPASPPMPAATAYVDYNQVFGSRGVDTKAIILSQPKPSYTDVARQNQVQGVVVLRAVFSSTGYVTNISVIRGLPDGLTERAIDAAKQIKFTPAVKDGHVVSMSIQLEYNFSLY